MVVTQADAAGQGRLFPFIFIVLNFRVFSEINKGA
jgi:hypothetical protein